MTHNEWSMVIHHRGGGRLAEGSDVRFEWSYRSPTGSPQAKWELEFVPLTAPAEERESGRVVRSGTTENEYIIDPALYDDMWRWSLTVWDSNGNGSNIGSGVITVAVAPQLVEPPVGAFLDSLNYQYEFHFDVPIESVSTDQETTQCDVDGHRVTCTIGFRLGYSGDQLQMCPTPGPEMPNRYYRVWCSEKRGRFSPETSPSGTWFSCIAFTRTARSFSIVRSRGSSRSPSIGVPPAIRGTSHHGRRCRRIREPLMWRTNSSVRCRASSWERSSPNWEWSTAFKGRAVF